ncbi:MAG: hypothetical protein JWO38_7017 [Gemmataceae bacterium]|nr:hypothetical protein [Gemmataceae bacterium]
MAVTNVTTFEQFFRAVAGLDVDKADLKRYHEFVNHKVRDLLVRAEATAKSNLRDIVEPHDLPITKGLQESIQIFENLDEEIRLLSVLDKLTARPPLALEYSTETETRLPVAAGGLSVALARAFKIIEPDLKNPQGEHWERVIRLFNLLL